MPELRPKVKKLYYSIGEVSRLTNLKAYVLRYWESEFSQLNPPKNRAGNRTYRQRDIDLIIKIKSLLYDKKYTIEGAKRSLVQKSEKKVGHVILEDDCVSIKKEHLSTIRAELNRILDIINK